jgi:hypothetical protein
VRTPTLASVQYTPDKVPDDQAELARYLTRELEKLQSAIAALSAGHLDVTTVAPTKPREGDFRLCDGVSWNPLGTGQKFVGYRGGAWVLLG